MLKTYFVKDLPHSQYEIALMGRSNVGKSSLLNRILKQNISRVSKTPGCTKWIGYYPFMGIGVVDLPGYGYAKTDKKRESLISNMVYDYIQSKRANEIWILIDSRRDIMEIDEELIKFITDHNIEIKIIATKCDKKESQSIKAYFYTSAKKISGIQEIIKYIKSIKTS